MPRVSWKGWLRGRKGVHAIQGPGCQSSFRVAVRKLGRASAFFIWGEGIVLPLSQCLNAGSRVTLESSLYLSELSALIGLWGSS